MSDRLTAAIAAILSQPRVRDAADEANYANCHSVSYIDRFLYSELSAAGNFVYSYTHSSRLASSNPCPNFDADEHANLKPNGGTNRNAFSDSY